MGGGGNAHGGIPRQFIEVYHHPLRARDASPQMHTGWRSRASGMHSPHMEPARPRPPPCLTLCCWHGIGALQIRGCLAVKDPE